MEHPAPTTPGSRRGFWIVLLAVTGFAALMAVFLKNADFAQQGGLAAGASAPSLEAAGWLNGDAPAQTPPGGRIRVMHAWSTNCLPCYREAAELVKLHAQYHNQGIEFVGVTFEPPQRLGDIKKFLADTGITWVNGYGAEQTFRNFGVEAVPCVWIINSEGRILWSLDSPEPLEEALPLALAGKLPVEPIPEP